VAAPRQCLRDVATRGAYGGEGVQTPRQERGNRGGGGAPRAVCVAGVYPGAREHLHAVPVEEHVCQFRHTYRREQFSLPPATET